MFHVALSLELIALAAGVGLLLVIKHFKDLRNGWTLFIGWLIVIISLISIICSIFFRMAFIEKEYKMYGPMMKGYIEQHKEQK